MVPNEKHLELFFLFPCHQLPVPATCFIRLIFWEFAHKLQSVGHPLPSRVGSVYFMNTQQVYLDDHF